MIVWILALVTGATLLILALAFAVFYWAVDTYFVQPARIIGDWISQIEIEDRGGDIGITLPTATDGAARGQTPQATAPAASQDQR